ncbi:MULTISPECIES: AAA family ATPase [Halomonadaceae]|uniref:DUF3696 domain-containing protein n=1 Tax=Vreelandella halophila TaxID=86177 RepID=A0A9X5B5S2_9GAMM|nr:MULTISPECIES: DUF3696 domain-containing protein [Halomonas]MYL26502.1 DUF3696 domain-containing protein [Halomonas utahensis]MYL73839.1 DUF3696 domain-containing protein [Halomonas sp. 22501_18_FS]
MIDSVELFNFKGFVSQEIWFGNITLLAGLNGSGKSSCVQAICLVFQSHFENKSLEKINLNGDFVALGKGSDLLSEFGDSDSVSIKLKNYIGEAVIEFDGNQDSSSLNVSLEDDNAVLDSVLNKDFQYLAADRVSPATIYNEKASSRYGACYIGKFGEYAGDFLSKNSDHFVDRDRLRDMADSDERKVKLIDAVAQWLDVISPEVSLEASSIPSTDNVSIRFRYKGVDKLGSTNWYRPTNVGFGITYVLPVIVSCLALPKGSLLVVENPEAHLHPKGQFEIGRMLSQAANQGVQIIIETHSDHVLNGIRLSVKENYIPANKVVLNYFSRNVSEGRSSVESPKIKNSGKLSYWPDGFFDEWGKSLERLLM